MNDGLSTEEDAELRGLHWLMRHGMVSEAVCRRYDELRARDRRIVVREAVDERTPRHTA